MTKHPFFTAFKTLLFISLFTISGDIIGQQSINKVSVNGLELNTQLDRYRNTVFLLTGDETAYANYPNIRQNVLKNITNGIREGVYNGDSHSMVDGKRATRTTMFFYKEELYKVRWSFQVEYYQNLEELAGEVNDFFLKRYGSNSTEIDSMMKAWEGRKRYLQTFLDESEFQIEYRDPKIHKKVEKLK